MLGKTFSRQFLEIFFPENRLSFHANCLLICMKCQSLFSWKIKKNIINLLSSEFAQRVVKVKGYVKCPKISNTLFHTFLFAYFLLFMQLILKILSGIANSVDLGLCTFCKSHDFLRKFSVRNFRTCIIIFQPDTNFLL